MFNYSDITQVIFNKEVGSQKMRIMERWSFTFTIITPQREYELYAPSEDERDMWLHTFNWISEINKFQKHQLETRAFQQQIHMTLKSFQKLNNKEQRQLSKSPSKLENILLQLDNRTKQPVEGDVKAIIDLSLKIKKIKENPPTLTDKSISESTVSIIDKHADSKHHSEDGLETPNPTKNKELQKIKDAIQSKKKKLEELENYKKELISEKHDGSTGKT